eukprot:TRINITY_DN2321_c0_g1_i2.p1 TRINITY_DN2321_c0_g1~~TRINITY_DN2321_c0_g1_i2.p1  ORF type:complete len:212 (-),score=48.19 TRINITY_DN2321_c0_g1_i2:646-1245(-)
MIGPQQEEELSVATTGGPLDDSQSREALCHVARGYAAATQPPHCLPLLVVACGLPQLLDQYLEEYQVGGWKQGDHAVLQRVLRVGTYVFSMSVIPNQLLLEGGYRGTVASQFMVVFDTQDFDVPALLQIRQALRRATAPPAPHLQRVLFAPVAPTPLVATCGVAPRVAPAMSDGDGLCFVAQEGATALCRHLFSETICN